MADVIPTQTKLNLMLAKFNLTGVAIKVALFTSTATPAAWTSRADFTNEVAAAGGYSTGGATITTPTVTADSTTGKFDGDDTTWAASTITARYAVVYQSNGGTAANDPILRIIDFGSDKSSSSGPFTLQWDATGIFRIA